jgi:hypothetical protein
MFILVSRVRGNDKCGGGNDAPMTKEALFSPELLVGEPQPEGWIMISSTTQSS